MLGQTLARLRSALPQLLIVTRASLVAAVRDVLAEQATAAPPVLVCPQPEQGMASSLAFAAAHLPEDWHSALICLADMPFIRSDTYAAIAAAIAHATSNHPIVVPEFRGQRGNPVAFGAAFFPQLAGLKGDGGARPVLQANPQALLPLPVDDKGILLDVDRAEDLRHY